MKRLTAYLLSFCLFALSVLPAHGAESPSSIMGAGVDETVQTSSNDPASGALPSPAGDINGGVAQNPSDGINEGAVQTPSDSTNGEAVQNPSSTNGGTVQNPSDGTDAGAVQTPPDGTNEGGASVSPDETGQNSGQDALNPNPDGVLPGDANLSDENPVGTTVPQGTSWNDRAAASSTMGGIEVILRNTLPIDKMAITVTIEKNNAVVSSQAVSLENDPKKHSVYFPVEPGIYCLKTAAPGFLTFSQDISVQGDVKTAEVHTGFINLDNISYSGGAVHPGVMMIGDANSDGVIDEKDKNAIIDAISGEWNGSDVTDLNGDGKTDLVDLQHYADSRAKLNAGMDTSASVASSISPNAIQINVNEATTKAEGNISDLLAGTGECHIVQKPGRDDFRIQSGGNRI